MSDQVEFILFGDQSQDTHAFLADFYCHGHRSTLSRSFLEQVSTALVQEIDSLPSVQRRKLPVFSNIEELNERYHVESTRNCAIDSALLCISQLAHYLE